MGDYRPAFRHVEIGTAADQFGPGLVAACEREVAGRTWMSQSSARRGAQRILATTRTSYWPDHTFVGPALATIQIVVAEERWSQADRVWVSLDVCQNGHPRTPENVYVNTHGVRICRPCRRAGLSRWRARRATAR